MQVYRNIRLDRSNQSLRGWIEQRCFGGINNAGIPGLFGLKIWEQHLFVKIQKPTDLLIWTYMVQNCSGIIPIDVNGVASPVGSKSRMQWLQEKNKEKWLTKYWCNQKNKN